MNAELEAYKAQLTASFNARLCPCGTAAVLVMIGDDPVVEAGIRLTTGSPDRNLCLFHAGLFNNARAA